MNQQTQAITQDMGAKAVRLDRRAYLKSKNGDLVGVDNVIPKGDFSSFLGWGRESNSEREGKVSGARTLELAIKGKLDQVAKNAQGNMSGRNMETFMYDGMKRPGRGGDVGAAGVDAMQSNIELNSKSNMKYLELQYKMNFAFQSHSTLSNLMKARNETTRKMISEVK